MSIAVAVVLAVAALLPTGVSAQGPGTAVICDQPSLTLGASTETAFEILSHANAGQASEIGADFACTLSIHLQNDTSELVAILGGIDSWFKNNLAISLDNSTFTNIEREHKYTASSLIQLRFQAR